MRHGILTFPVLILMLVTASLSASDTIHTAAAAGDLEKVKALLAENSELLESLDDNGRTALHLAALGGHAEVMDFLLVNGANPDAADKQGLTPLFFAGYRGHADIVERLLDAGADVSRASTLLMIVCNKGDSKLLALLLNRGLDPNSRLMRGFTALHMTGTFGNTEMAAMLLEHGADVKARTDDGKTPLLWAVGSYRATPQYIELLVSNGADVNLADNDGETPLLKSTRQGYTKISELLLSKGADITARDPHSGRTCLHLAAIYGYSDLVKMLLDHHCDPAAEDDYGNTAGIYAAKHGNKSACQLLDKKYTGRKTQEMVFGKSPLPDTLSDGEAALVYLKRRGWTVKTRSRLLVFDSEEFGRLPDEPCLANGHITAEDINGQNILAIYTCYHGKPGEPAPIHELAGKIENIQYIQYKEDKWRGPENSLYLGPRENKLISDLEIITAQMENSLSYIVKVDGLTIYYSGFRNEPDQYKKEIDFLAGQADSIDIAFIASDDSEKDREGFDEWLFYTIDSFKPLAIVPTNHSDKAFIFRKIAVRIEARYPGMTVFCADNPGDSYQYSRAEMKR